MDRIYSTNQFKTTISITRGELCDLLLAILAAKYTAEDGGRKWINLHDKLQTQLEELDSQLYGVQKIGADIYKNE